MYETDRTIHVMTEDGREIVIERPEPPSHSMDDPKSDIEKEACELSFLIGFTGLLFIFFALGILCGKYLSG